MNINRQLAVLLTFLMCLSFVCISCRKSDEEEENQAHSQERASTELADASSGVQKEKKLLQNIRTLMRTGQKAASAELIGIEKSNAGFAVPIYGVHYRYPKMSSSVYCDLGRRCIITKEIFEKDIIVLFKFTDNILVSYDGEQLPLNFFDIPSYISVHKYNRATQSPGRQLDRYTFVGDSTSDLRYKSDSQGELQIPREFFDRVPIPHQVFP